MKLFTSHLCQCFQKTIITDERDIHFTFDLAERHVQLAIKEEEKLSEAQTNEVIQWKLGRECDSFLCETLTHTNIPVP